ncbi:MAG: N-glycosylase/DNA lyase [Pyrobaculum sp.]|jgi:hypothetical protein
MALNVDKIEEVARELKKVEIRQDQYLDKRFYPPPDDPRESQLAYFVSMVAIDHRTSQWGPFEGVIQEEFFHGADALYRLGRLAYDEGFFAAERLAELTTTEARKILSIGELYVWDFNTRVLLLRDVGKKALKNGGFEKMLNVSTIEKLREVLQRLRAYEDPVGKKVMLLAKFLHGRKLIEFKDLENADVPVDNHLSRIAYRTGIVDIDYDFLFSGVETTREEDIKLRDIVKTAWRIVAKFADIHPFTLDDFLWNFGRRICKRDMPNCQICPFREICKAHSISRYPPEHQHLITWYY